MFNFGRKRIVGWLIRKYQQFRIFWYRQISFNAVRGDLRCYQPVQTIGAGSIVVEDGVSIGVFPSPHFLTTYGYLDARSASAKIFIGSGTWINNNFCAIAEHSTISIGRRCLIGVNVEILDSDFHGLKVEERSLSLSEWANPVLIGDDVFIGSNCKVLKGATIGNGSIIANGSVVVGSIPEGVVAGGVPARVLKKIEK